MMNKKRNSPWIIACRAVFICLVIASLSLSSIASAQDAPASERVGNMQLDQADVVIDGRMLFPVGGISSYPAERRAELFKKRIIELAKDESFDPATLRMEDMGDRTAIKAGSVMIGNFFDPDAEIEGVNRQLLAEINMTKIAEAIKAYRHDRSPERLLRKSGVALIATLVGLLLWWGIVRLMRWLGTVVQRRVKRNLHVLEKQAHSIFSASQIWRLIAGLLKLVKVVSLLLLIYFYLNTVLGLFPWTRQLAIVLFDLILGPLESMANGFIKEIPDLAFLIVFVFVVRYLLSVIRVFFLGVKSGRIRLENFDHDWAIPTYKIIRVLVIAFALVIAYPYIPGSDSLAFKGVSVFMGVILSLGATSFISSMIAGLIMTYRGAFKEGDRIRIGDTVGVATDIKLMTTRVKTAKNEMVVIPNSNILNTDIINYSTMAREKTLILPTVVGIGYDTPWRQVEAMLLEAAKRTAGSLAEPAPFVLQQLLGDYAVNYELNIYTGDEVAIPNTYSELHGHIQDVFNEFGVQIMSPAYIADPESDKIVPPEDWFAAPAKAPE